MLCISYKIVCTPMNVGLEVEAQFFSNQQWQIHYVCKMIHLHHAQVTPVLEHDSIDYFWSKWLLPAPAFVKSNILSITTKGVGGLIHDNIGRWVVGFSHSCRIVNLLLTKLAMKEDLAFCWGQ
ncbi:hypothetical protein CR513_27612, partial [Mucuna pruriens]